MSDQITLYDIACKPPTRCWSFNPWKTRLILNYKNIPYNTHWLEIPAIAPHLTALSIPPNPPNNSALLSAPYTLPTIRIPASHSHSNSNRSNNKNPNSDTVTEDKYIMDSTLIAHELENRYPNPPLPSNTPKQTAIETLWPQIMQILGPAILPNVTRLINPASRDHFIRTREEAFGVKIKDFDHPDVMEKAWRDVRPVVEEMAGVLKENGGPFVEGEVVSYADFVVVGIMVFLERAGAGAVERFREVDGAFGRLWEACEVWMVRDD
ncbi:MAG: hypothetical protein Q9221_005594 [Calogaya cf. arnoldii]